MKVAIIRRLTRVSLLLLLGVAACEGPPPDPYRSAYRLRESIAIGPEGRFGWNCSVADDLRPALGCSRVDQLLHEVRTFPETENVPAVASVPLWLIGKPLIVQTKLLSGAGAAWETRQTIFYEKAPARLDLAIPLEAMRQQAPGELRVLVEGRGVYDKRQLWVSQEIDVPASATFTTAVALEQIALGTKEAAAALRIEAVANEDRKVLFEGVVTPEDGNRWKEVTVDLSSFAGTKIRIHFSSEWQSEGIAFPLFGAPQILARRPRGKAKNVILVSLDTLRGDHLGKYFEDIQLMPAVDALSKEGTIFEKAFSAYPSTSAGHMTIFTSSYPATHRVTFANQLAPRWLVTLPEVFAKHGYETGAVTENAMLSAHSGFSRGFDSYKENKGVGHWEASGQAEKTVTAGIDWLESHRDEVFFLFLHTYEVHTPYEPPEDVALPDPGPGAHRHVVMSRRYQGEVRHTDRMMARLFQALERLDLTENTILVITSDHGEAFGEHGKIGHSWQVYDEYLHVPLILWAPGLVPEGRRIPQQVSTIDVGPTLLDLLGLPTPATMRGTSLAPILRGEKAEHDEEWIFMEAPKGRTPQKRLGRIFAARSKDYKFVTREFADSALEIYDLNADPAEKENLKDDPELQAKSREVLAEYHALNKEAQRRDANGQVTPPEPTKPLDSATQKKLKALGYVD